jgi:hypothetical protein
MITLPSSTTEYEGLCELLPKVSDAVVGPTASESAALLRKCFMKVPEISSALCRFVNNQVLEE